MGIKKRTDAFFKAHRQVVRFLSLFALIFGLCYFFFNIVVERWFELFRPFLAFQAKAVVSIINLFGAGAWAENEIVHSLGSSMRIARGCDGVEALSFLLAGVLAFPTSGRSKVIGIVIGVPLIQAINLARLVLLYYAAASFPALFEGIHIYVGQALLILSSTGIFIFWLALTSYTVWLVAMGMLVRRAILEDPNLVSAPVRTMPDRPTAAA